MAESDSESDPDPNSEMAKINAISYRANTKYAVAVHNIPAQADWLVRNKQRMTIRNTVLFCTLCSSHSIGCEECDGKSGRSDLHLRAQGAAAPVRRRHRLQVRGG